MKSATFGAGGGPGLADTKLLKRSPTTRVSENISTRKRLKKCVLDLLRFGSTEVCDKKCDNTGCCDTGFFRVLSIKYFLSGTRAGSIDAYPLGYLFLYSVSCMQSHALQCISLFLVFKIFCPNEGVETFNALTSPELSRSGRDKAWQCEKRYQARVCFVIGRFFAAFERPPITLWIFASPLRRMSNVHCLSPKEPKLLPSPSVATMKLKRRARLKRVACYGLRHADQIGIRLGGSFHQSHETPNVSSHAVR